MIFTIPPIKLCLNYFVGTSECNFLVILCGLSVHQWKQNNLFAVRNLATHSEVCLGQHLAQIQYKCSGVFQLHVI